METCIPSSSFYFRNPQGHYGLAEFIKSRRAYRLVHLTPAGDVVGSVVKPDHLALRRIRRLKNRPARAAIRAAGW